MSIFPRRLPLPPASNKPDEDFWKRQVTEAIRENLAAYGEMYYPFSEAISTQAGVGTSYTTYLTYLREDEKLNLSTSTANGTFTIENPGMYEISFDVSVSGPNNTEFDFEFHVNGSEISHGVRMNIQSNGDIGSGHINARQRLEVNDVVSVHVKSDAGGGADLETYNSSFGLTKIAI